MILEGHKGQTVISIAMSTTACLNFVPIVDRAADDASDLFGRTGIRDGRWNHGGVQVVKRDMGCEEEVSSKDDPGRVMSYGCQEAVVAGDALDVSHRKVSDGVLSQRQRGERRGRSR